MDVLFCLAIAYDQSILCLDHHVEDLNQTLIILSVRQQTKHPCKGAS